MPENASNPEFRGLPLLNRFCVVVGMTKIAVEYRGDLRCEVEHVDSGTKIMTDAPVDNHGKGEFFSPTDLCVTALATCYATLMGIQANILKLDISGTKIDSEKVMAQGGLRRIGKITMAIHIPHDVSEDNQRRLEAAAKKCPVHQSLHPDIEIEVQFYWNKVCSE